MFLFIYEIFWKKKEEIFLSKLNNLHIFKLRNLHFSQENSGILKISAFFLAILFNFFTFTDQKCPYFLFVFFKNIFLGSDFKMSVFFFYQYLGFLNWENFFFFFQEDFLEK